MAEGLTITISDTASPADRRELDERLNAFNMEQSGFRDYRELACFIRDDDGRLVAGIDGFTWGGYARVTTLWVDESLRGQGLGRRLLEAAEAEAAGRGCVTVALSSHEFQAPDFYLRLGYQLLGTVGDAPVGHREFHFAKRLSAPG